MVYQRSDIVQWRWTKYSASFNNNVKLRDKVGRLHFLRNESAEPVIRWKEAANQLIDSAVLSESSFDGSLAGLVIDSSIAIASHLDNFSIAKFRDRSFVKRLFIDTMNRPRIPDLISILAEFARESPTGSANFADSDGLKGNSSWALGFSQMQPMMAISSYQSLVRKHPDLTRFILDLIDPIIGEDAGMFSSLLSNLIHGDGLIAHPNLFYRDKDKSIDTWLMHEGSRLGLTAKEYRVYCLVYTMIFLCINYISAGTTAVMIAYRWSNYESLFPIDDAAAPALTSRSLYKDSYLLGQYRLWSGASNRGRPIKLRDPQGEWVKIGFDFKDNGDRRMIPASFLFPDHIDSTNPLLDKSLIMNHIISGHNQTVISLVANSVGFEIDTVSGHVSIEDPYVPSGSISFY